MDTNVQSAPAQAANAATAQSVVNPVVTAPVPTENAEITPEKREELSRKLNSSKEEALRLKAENERLAAEKVELEAALAQRQQSGNDPQVSEQEVEYLKALGKKAGFAFVPDVEAIKQSSYKERQQIEFEAFMLKHPEMNKPGDPKSDQLWANFQAEITQYMQPKNAADWGKLFEKGYRNITWSEQNAIERGKALGYAQANMTNQSQLGSGSLGGSAAPMTQESSPERQAISQGFAAVRPQYYK